MSTTLSFGLSGGGDSVALVGYFEIIPSAVPEPSTYAMLLAGLGVIGVFARRRQQI